MAPFLLVSAELKPVPNYIVKKLVSYSNKDNSAQKENQIINNSLFCYPLVV